MMEFGSHPSIYISFIILPFWIIAISNKFITTVCTFFLLLYSKYYLKQSFFTQYYPKLLKISEMKMLHLDPFHTNSNSTFNNDDLTSIYFAKLEFDTRSEYSNIFGTVRNKCLELVRAITHLNVFLVFIYFYLYLTARIVTYIYL